MCKASRKSKLLFKKVLTISLCIFCAVNPMTGSRAAWDGYEEPAKTAADKIQLVDFNNLSGIFAMKATPSNKYTGKDFDYCAYWNEHRRIGFLSVAYAAGFPRDWSPFQNLALSIYSPKATQATVKVVMYSDGEGNYFHHDFTLDWVGWKEVSINLVGMAAARDADMTKMLRMEIVANGAWSLVGNPQSELYIASIYLTGAGITSKSLNLIYQQNTIDTALAAMENAAAVYGGSAGVVKREGVLDLLVSGDESVTAKTIDGTVFVPASFFADHLGAAAPESGYGTAAQSIDGAAYLPAAETAQKLGKRVVVDEELVVIGEDNTIDLFRRVQGLGVNEFSEIIAYLACYQEVDPDSLIGDACAQIKKNWREKLVGTKERNDISNERTVRMAQSITSAGQSAWNAMVKTPGSGELFTGITTVQSSDMTITYQMLYNMARAWGTYGSALYNNNSLRKDILFGLKWMYENRYGQAELEGKGWRDTGAFNWWDWQIGSPKHLLRTLMIMEEQLTSAEVKSYTALFDKLVPTPRDVAANRIDTGLLVIGSAALSNDPERILRAQMLMEEVMLFVDNHRNKKGTISGERSLHTALKGQGFYTDGSYVYHTLQPMNGTYGMEHFEMLVEYLQIVQGTPFAVQTPHVKNVKKFLYDAFDPFFYQGAMFRMVLGRNDTPNEYAWGQRFVSIMLNFLDFAGEEDRAKVKSMIKEYVLSNPAVDFYSLVSVGKLSVLAGIMADDFVPVRGGNVTNRVLYNMDKAVHRRGGWAAGISMSSSRMFNYQSINGQNRKGWYLGDGMTEYHVKGDYTSGSAAYWRDVDYYRLPGTTVDAQPRQEASIGDGNDYLSSKDFVGGVSLDKTYGTAAMWLESYHNAEDFGVDRHSYGGKAPAHTSDLTAKKGYFMFDEELVALGSAVNATDNNRAEVLTIIDNRLAKQTRSLSENSGAAGRYGIRAVAASETPQPENSAGNTVDGDYTSRWASEAGASITWDLGETKELGYIALSFMGGSRRTQSFSLEVSQDNAAWEKVFDGSSAGNTEREEFFDLKGKTGRYVRFTNFGNSIEGSTWVSLTEAGIYPYNDDGSIGFTASKVMGTDAFTVDGREVSLSGGEQALHNPVWAHLEGAAGYYFPQNAGNAAIRAQWVSGENTSFLQLWASHGVNPQNGSYAYVLLPGKTAAETWAYAENPAVSVLSNTPALQAVRHGKLGITSVIFWEAGSFEGIAADRPMLVMVQRGANGTKVAVSDPTQKLTEGTVTISGGLPAAQADEKMRVSFSGGSTKIKIDFTESRGRSMQALLTEGDPAGKGGLYENAPQL